MSELFFCLYLNKCHTKQGKPCVKGAHLEPCAGPDKFTADCTCTQPSEENPVWRMPILSLLLVMASLLTSVYPAIWGEPCMKDAHLEPSAGHGKFTDISVPSHLRRTLCEGCPSRALCWSQHDTRLLQIVPSHLRRTLCEGCPSRALCWSQHDTRLLQIVPSHLRRTLCEGCPSRALCWSQHDTRLLQIVPSHLRRTLCEGCPSRALCWSRQVYCRLSPAIWACFLVDWVHISLTLGRVSQPVSEMLVGSVLHMVLHWIDSQSPIGLSCH